MHVLWLLETLQVSTIAEVQIKCMVVGMLQQCEMMHWLWVRTWSWQRVRFLFWASCMPRQKDKQKWEAVAASTEMQFLFCSLLLLLVYMLVKQRQSQQQHCNNHSNNNKRSWLGLFPNSCFGMACLLLASCVRALFGSDKKHTTSCTLKCTRNRKRDTVLQKETDWLQAFSRADSVVQHPGSWCSIANEEQIFHSLWRTLGQTCSQS